MARSAAGPSAPEMRARPLRTRDARDSQDARDARDARDFVAWVGRL